MYRDIPEELRVLIEPVVDDAGFELVDAMLTRGRAPWLLRVTIDTPEAVWLRVARGEIDGRQALMDGLYRAEGDLLVLAKLTEWFPVPRPTSSRAGA